MVCKRTAAAGGSGAEKKTALSGGPEERLKRRLRNGDALFGG